MSDYSFVLSCSKNYLYGLNALLNSLDYYGNTADVNILWLEHNVRECEDLSKDFHEKIKGDVFNFKVNILDIMEFLKDYKYKIGNVWMLKFSRWLYIATLKEKYKAVCSLGADILVLNDIMNYFEFVENTNIVITGRNALGTYNFYSPELKHTNDVPYADVPAYFDPKKCEDFCRRIYEIGMAHNMGDMPAFYYALVDTKKRVTTLTDNLWIRNFTHYRDPLSEGKLDGKKFIVSGQTRSRVNMVHGKWWDRVRVLKEIKSMISGPNKDITNRNFTLYRGLYEYFNTQWKLKLEWRDLS